MQKYQQIGETYLLIEQGRDKYLLWAVIENDFNYDSTILEVVEEGPDFGRKVIVSTSWVNDQPDFGLLIEPAGKIAFTKGIQFIKKPGLFPEKAKTLK